MWSQIQTNLLACCQEGVGFESRQHHVRDLKNEQSKNGLNHNR